MPDTVARLSFNYGSLDTDTAQFLQRQTSEIKELFRHSIENILRIGHSLIQVKERLPHGQWLDWLAIEFQWTERTARNYMQTAEEFKWEKISDLDIAASALYLLASPSTPDEAREEALARAQSGERITVSSAKEMRERYVPPKGAPAAESPLERTPQPEVEVQTSQPDSQIQPPSQPPVQVPPPVESKPATSAKRRRAKEDKPLVVAPKRVAPGEWWKLGKDNYLYCGDHSSAEFQKLLPKKIALSLQSPPNRESWPQSSPSNATSVVSIQTAYQEDQDLSLLREAIERFLEVYTDGGDTVVLSFLADTAILPLVDELGCIFFCAEPDPNRCDAAITVWTTTGRTAEKMKTRQTGKKRLSSPALAK